MHFPLTGLLNRRAFEEAMTDAIANAKRHHRLVSLLLVDADHFKRINDSFGHAVGDEVLKKLAELLKARLRLNDVVARVGGEEFAVLIPEGDPDGALKVARDIVERVASTDFPTLGQVTVSVGLCTLAYANDIRERLLRLADEAMYGAKDAGRNQVLQHPGSVTGTRVN